MRPGTDETGGSFGMIHREEGWDELLAEVRSAPGTRTVYVVGASDRGKTTFCRYLSEALSEELPTAYIDCDPGQSSIGPPACLGMRRILRLDSAGERSVLSFVGSLSPKGHLLQSLSGAKKLAQKAVDLGCRAVILDSSGFVAGNVGREFQFTLIDLIRPGFLVAFQREDELEGLLENFARSPHTRVRRMPVSPAVRERSPMMRQAYRTERFRHYFRDAGIGKIRLSGKGLHGDIPDFRRPGSCKDLLIALCDPGNFVSVLAVIRAYRSKAGVLEVLAPPFDIGEVSTVHFGSLYLDEDFRTTAKPRHR